MTIESFEGQYRFLSNFFYAPMNYEGHTYWSAEAAYQAAKCLNPEDKELFLGKTAQEAKKLGRKIQIRPDWDDVKIDIMKDIVKTKFTQYSYLKEQLIKTKDEELIEGNWWGDTFWGVDSNGIGENHLGQILMELRRELLNV
jgi:ribA/ribD-fused uncharacterized protein